MERIKYMNKKKKKNTPPVCWTVHPSHPGNHITGWEKLLEDIMNDISCSVMERKRASSDDSRSLSDARFASISNSCAMSASESEVKCSCTRLQMSDCSGSMSRL